MVNLENIYKTKQYQKLIIGNVDINNNCKLYKE